MIVHVIDDNNIVLMVLRKIIKKHGISDNVHSFKNGEEALSSLKKGIENPALLPDVILLDLNMPVLDGWKFLEEFEKLESKLDKPIDIYILTSSISERDRERASGNRFVKGYITKPVNHKKIKRIAKSA